VGAPLRSHPQLQVARPRLFGGWGGLALALRRLTPFVLFAMIPAAVAGELLSLALDRHVLGLDFREAFWPAGRAVLDGRTPYPPLDGVVLAHGTSFVYPPLDAIVVAPLALLPLTVATALAVIATALAVAGTMWALDVRDWRCYGVAFASAPVLDCVQTASMSAFFALGIALAWRWRAAGLRTPLLIAAVVAAKLFLWPVLLWLLVVRGFRCALLTAIGAAVAVIGPWLLGFPGLTDYPRLLSLLVDVEGRDGYSPRALMLALGSGQRLAQVASVVAGGCVLALAGLEWRRGGAPLRVLALTLLASLLLSPLVWSHYFVVLLPVIAIACPRLGWPWFIFIAFWAGGGAPTLSGGPAQIALGLAVTILAALTGLLPGRLVRAGRPAILRRPAIAAARTR
jgi:alpha-1,2-mannosyltransferase